MKHVATWTVEKMVNGLWSAWRGPYSSRADARRAADEQRREQLGRYRVTRQHPDSDMLDLMRQAAEKETQR